MAAKIAEDTSGICKRVHHFSPVSVEEYCYELSKYEHF